MATTKQTKKNIVLDEDFKILRREKNFKYRYSYNQQQFALQGENLQKLQLQCAKEKQLLQQLKKDRVMENKARSILRRYAVYEKYQEEDRDDDDNADNADNADNDKEDGTSGSVQWEHQGCNAVCKADKCIWWLLESGLC